MDACPFHRMMTPENNVVMPMTPQLKNMETFAADPVAFMKQLKQEQGDLARVDEGPVSVYFVFNAELNKQVLSNATDYHSQFFAIRGSKRSAQRRLTSGLLSMNGEAHREHRRLVKNPFSRKGIQQYYDLTVQFAEEMLSEWSVGDVFDVNEQMTQYMLRVISAVLFGVDKPEMAFRIGKMIDRWVHYNHELGPLAFSPNSQLSDRYSEMLDYAEELEKEVAELVQMRHECGLGNDILSLLIQASEKEGGITQEELIGHITLLFAAGHLTTAHTLTWTLVLLSQHPEIMTQLHQELHNTYEGIAPTLEQAESMPFLERVLKESMRVLPSSSYSQRMAANSTQLGDQQLRPGSIVIFSQFMTHHSEQYYENPDRFDPDRWLNTNVSPYAYLPFGNGPRMCIGAALAMQILKVSVPMLLKSFKIEMVPGTQVDARVISTMLNPMTPIMVQLKPVSDEYRTTPIHGTVYDLVDFPTGSSQDSKVA